MKLHSPSFLARLVLCGGCALAAWSFVQPHGAAAHAQWRAAAAGPASFLQSGAPAAVLPGPAAAGANRGHLPNSTIGTVIGAAQCSVDTSDPGTPPSCSVHALTINRRCSAQCDSGQRCSAFVANLGTGGAAECSTSGVPNGACSAVQPSLGATAGSLCSVLSAPALVTPRLQCSVLKQASKQVCSAENPGTANNFCSADGQGPTAQCSVLSLPVALNVRGACSTGFAGGKRCSVRGTGTECSVIAGTIGICTNLAGAPLGSCSVNSTIAGRCSVIGGANGTLCRQP